MAYREKPGKHTGSEIDGLGLARPGVWGTGEDAVNPGRGVGERGAMPEIAGMGGAGLRALEGTGNGENGDWAEPPHSSPSSPLQASLWR